VLNGVVSREQNPEGTTERRGLEVVAILRGDPGTSKVAEVEEHVRVRIGFVGNSSDPELMEGRPTVNGLLGYYVYSMVERVVLGSVVANEHVATRWVNGNVRLGVHSWV
jgi:hypothetical protein